MELGPNRKSERPPLVSTIVSSTLKIAICQAPPNSDGSSGIPCTRTCRLAEELAVLGRAGVARAFSGLSMKLPSCCADNGQIEHACRRSGHFGRGRSTFGGGHLVNTNLPSIGKVGKPHAAHGPQQISTSCVVLHAVVQHRCCTIVALHSVVGILGLQSVGRLGRGEGGGGGASRCSTARHRNGL